MKPEFVRNPYNYDSDAVSNETGLLCKDESLAEQEFVEECDINYIAEKFMKTGNLPQVVDMPTYGDFDGVFDFQTAMNLINHAKQEFMALPAKIRTRFNNDPGELIRFFDDPENWEEARRLGFIPNRPDILPDEQSNQPETTRATRPENSSTPTRQPEATTRPGRAQAAPEEGQGAEKPRRRNPETDRERD